jgi:hypothetical protein
MRNYFDDEEEFEDELDDLTLLEMEKQREAMKRDEFIKNCKDAYAAIVSDPDSIVDPKATPKKKENLINAINRMSALFILEESYEKCGVLKSFMESRVPGGEFSPSVEEVKAFLGQ